MVIVRWVGKYDRKNVKRDVNAQDDASRGSGEVGWGAEGGWGRRAARYNVCSMPLFALQWNKMIHSFFYYLLKLPYSNHRVKLDEQPFFNV